MSRPNVLTVARVAGVPVRVHWSWPPLMLALVAALAQVYARGPAASPWAVAAITAALLSLSLLLHELAHALVARRLGMRVLGIALFALGGVTEIADGRATAGRALVVALAGPAASLTLAAAATLAWWLGIGPAGPAAHLALANWALTAFNLLPGHPLDGGRALTAVLWFLMGEELQASRAAAHVARALGWGLVALGLGYALATGDASNAAWMVVLGLFLSLNAMDGYRRLALQRALRGLTAADLMRRAYRAVRPEMLLEEFAGQYVLGAHEHGFPVIARAEAGGPQRLVGIMTLRDLRRFRLHHWSSVEVGQAMIPAHRLPALAPDTPAGEALRTLLESGEELLPVMEGEFLSGVLRRGDVVSYLQGRLSKG
jgi:Zn-dependent protease